MAVKYKLIQKINPSKPAEAKKVYAIAVHEKTFKLKELARELAARSTTASEGDVYSVLIGMRDLMKEHLDRSDRVVIDGIGSFAINLSSDGAESEEKFHTSLIKKARVVYQEDAEMKEFSKNIKFEKTLSK
jgi:predicted histone-like DNA-binding protein